MSREMFGLKSLVVFVALSVLSLGYVQAQTCTPGQILQCDPGGSGTPVDSVISQDANGNVGIGTNVPDGLQVNIGVAETARGVKNVRLGVLSNTPRIIFEDAGFTQWEIDNIGGRLRIFHPSVERFTILDNGNVGIGTTNPQAKLHVAGGVGNIGAMLDLTPNGGGNLAILNNTNDNRIYLEGWGNGTLNADEMLITGQFPFYLPRFSVLADRTEIRGHLAVNGSPNISNGISLPNIANTEGRGIANRWDTYSSRRWKENITPIDNALAKVERLRGVYYDWKESQVHDMGFIAEEVGEVIPEVVSYEANGKDAQAVDYARLTALLVEAVKELKTENEALKHRLEVLENK